MMSAGGCVSAGNIVVKGLILVWKHTSEKRWGVAMLCGREGSAVLSICACGDLPLVGGINPTRGHELAGKALTVFCV